MVSIERAAGILLRAACEQAYSCLRLGLKCIDAPLLTSGMLRRYGISSDHSIASFWKLVDKLTQTRYYIYKSRSMCFRVVLNHTVENAYKLKCYNVYVDHADCIERECVVAPHTHVLRAYLEGVYDHNVMLRVNVVWVLRLVCDKYPSFCKSLEVLSERPLSPQLITEVALQALSIVERNKRVLSSLLTPVPSSLEELLEASPVLRRVLGGGEGLELR